MTTRFVRAPSIVWRRTAIAVLARAVDGELVALEGSGMALWEELAEPVTVAEVARRLAARYAASDDEVAGAVGRVLEDLVAAGVVAELT